MWKLALYLSSKYLFSRTNAVAVNFISWVAVLALTFSTAALLVILSTFSGLEELNLKFSAETNPHLKITPKTGKWFDDLARIEQILSSEKTVDAYSKIIEEKVYIRYKGKEDIAYILGVDEKLGKVLAIDSMLLEGTWEQLHSGNTIFPALNVARRLQLYYDDQEAAKLMVPKPGSGLINSEEEDFNARYAYAKGRFFYNDKWKSHILTSIDLARELLQDSTQNAYAIFIRITNVKNQIQVKKSLEERLGKQNVNIATQVEQDAAFLRLMNIEKLIIYLIFLLVLGIASFSLIGAIIVIVIEKQKQFLAFRSMGYSRKQIRTVFLILGLRITVISVVIGLGLGLIVCLLQQKFGLVMATAYEPFPVAITLSNLALISFTVLFLGVIVSVLVARRIQIGGIESKKTE